MVAGCVIDDRVDARDLDTHTNDGTSNGSDAGPDAIVEVSEGCEDYCRDVMANCTGEYAVYDNQELCEQVCMHLPPGDPAAPEGNTVACRARQASLAKTTGEPEAHCPNAGPGGNDNGSGRGCGTDCEAYCYLHAELCDIEGEFVLETEECLRQCSGLVEKRTFDVVFDHDGTDTVECRLVHVSSAAVAPLAHCWHASMAPQPESPCLDLPEANVPCDVYCDLVMVACTDEHSVYETRKQCESVCAVLPPGKAGDVEEDTIGCRRYHSYNSLAAPAVHCPHAGPTGDGHCGQDNCESYCRILKAACEQDFIDTYLADEVDPPSDALGDCPSECRKVDGSEADSSYSVEPPPTGNELATRIYHAVRALDDANECDAAMGL